MREILHIIENFSLNDFSLRLWSWSRKIEFWNNLRLCWRLFESSTDEHGGETECHKYQQTRDVKRTAQGRHVSETADPGTTEWWQEHPESKSSSLVWLCVMHTMDPTEQFREGPTHPIQSLNCHVDQLFWCS